jgi:signal transduction histidine kinase
MDLSLIKISQIIPLISSMFVFWFGFFVLSKGKKTEMNITFFLFSLAVTGWLFGTFMLFGSKGDEQAIFWDKLIYNFVILIPPLLYHFTNAFVEKTGMRKRIFIALTYLVFLILLYTNIFTDQFVGDIFYYAWGIHAKAKIFHHIFLGLFILYSFEVYRLIIIFFLKSKGIKRQRAKFIFIALLNFGTIGFVGFLPAYEVSVYPFAYISGLLFAVITGYAITRYQFLEIKSFAAQLLIISINIIAFSYILISESLDEYIIKTVFFIGMAFTSYLLKLSFDKGNKQKEELEKLTKKLAKSNNKLKELDRAKNEFISITAHQLRTPPTVIKGYISLAQEDPNNILDEDTKESLNRALISNERLIDLVEDILNVSRIESKNMKYEMKENQLCEDVLNELFDAFALKAKSKGLKLILNRPKKELPRIIMDRKRIREVVSNLVDNAIKYTPKGNVEISAKQSKNNIRIEVKDSGVGIAKDEMSYLFKKFSRGKNPDRLGAGGTGLGIFVDKKIVEDHGGRIWAESRGINKGSTFIIEIPIKSKEAQTLMAKDAKKVK